MSSQNKHISVIDCAVKQPVLSCYNQLIFRHSIRFSYHLPALHSTETIENLPSLDGVIVLGSASSVNDNLPWQKFLANFIQNRVLDQNIPLLGICFGHQLIAKISGAKIGFVQEDQAILKKKRTMKFEKNFGKIQKDEELTVGVSHGEEVKNLPNGFELLATADDSALEGLMHKTKPCFTFQSHPEGCINFLTKRVGLKEPSEIKEVSQHGHKILTQFIEMI